MELQAVGLAIVVRVTSGISFSTCGGSPGPLDCARGDGL